MRFEIHSTWVIVLSLNLPWSLGHILKCIKSVKYHFPSNIWILQKSRVLHKEIDKVGLVVECPRDETMEQFLEGFSSALPHVQVLYPGTDLSPYNPFKVVVNSRIVDMVPDNRDVNLEEQLRAPSNLATSVEAPVAEPSPSLTGFWPNGSSFSIGWWEARCNLLHQTF